MITCPNCHTDDNIVCERPIWSNKDISGVDEAEMIIELQCYCVSCNTNFYSWYILPNPVMMEIDEEIKGYSY